jgi:hypothetical protein
MLDATTIIWRSSMPINLPLEMAARNVYSVPSCGRALPHAALFKSCSGKLWINRLYSGILNSEAQIAVPAKTG